MTNINISVQSYSQNGQKFYSLVLPFEVIDRLSEVLEYGINEYGYQRKPIEKHYKKIADYILSNPKSFILPSSIILAIDESEEDLFFKLRNEGVTFFIPNRNQKYFHIVDGQHRLRGLKEASRTLTSVIKFELNVIVLVVSKANPLVELEVFNDINSKGKKIKIDLVELARFSYRLKTGTIKNEEIFDHIAIRTAYDLNESSAFKNSVLKNSVKLDIHAEDSLGILGVHYFNESIRSIINYYYKKHPKLNSHLTIKECDAIAESVAKYINTGWEIIKNKWPNCFHKYPQQSFLFEEVQQYFYDDKYIIQKTIGAKVLNGILGDLLNKFKSETEALDEFRNLLSLTLVKDSDWLRGGEFSGFSSEAGFNKVKKIVSGLNKY